jgi:rubrerythrin
MPDREKVIKSIEDCVSQKNNCVDCDYDGCVFKHGDCRRDLLADALALLKEREITEWEHLWDAPDGTYKGRCKKCGFVHIFIEAHDSQYIFCPSCGRSAK